MNNIIEVTINRLAHGGDGVGTYLSGLKVFVPYSVPGDVLKVEVVKQHKRHLEAKIKEIIEPSKDRVEPKCPYFYKCGGCHWQHVRYEMQLYWKQTILEETLKRMGKVDGFQTLPIIPSPREWNYRNNIRMHVDEKGGVGFFEKLTNDLVEIYNCMIAEDGVNELLKDLRAREKRQEGDVELYAGQNKGFRQSNPLQNENLKNLLNEWLKEVPHSSVLELYCGDGNFTFDIAKLASQIVAVDSNRIAIDSVVKRNNLPNISFVCNTAFGFMKNLTKKPTDIDCIVMDPPRKGAYEIIEMIGRIKPKAILYISCSPDTLARDVKALVGCGYSFIKTQALDMFPQTYHIESLNLLTLTEV